MASDEIPFLEVYGSINNGAHRQAADLIGAPAFIWHQSFWYSASNQNERVIRADVFQNYIQDVKDQIGKISNSKLNVENEIKVEPNDRSNVILFGFQWHEMRAKIRFEIHTEYLTITASVDASIKTKESTPTEELAKNVMQQIENFIEMMSAPEKVNVQLINRFVYEDIWELHFFPQILNVDNRIRSGYIGKKFADFRGFITCEQYPSSVNEEKDDLQFIEYLETKEIQRPFYRADEGERGQWHRTTKLPETWARSRLNQVWPFLAVVPEKQPASLNGRTEFTVSRILRGRALYVTAMAPQPKLGFPGNEQPLHLYIHSSTRCEREIGRMVDRLMQLGTLRLAAIIALPHLNKVRNTLEIVEKVTNEARTKIHELILFTKKTKSRTSISMLAIENKEKEILSLLDNIQKKMAELSDGQAGELGTYMGSATLEYRLIRSLFYKKSFFGLLDGLGTERLEGYQKYDEFVFRRLGGAFEFIEGVERRIEDIKKNWRSLDQLYLTTTVTILTGGIENQQNDNREIQTKIEKIQSLGEIFLIGVLVPYYVISIVFHILSCEKNTWCHAEIFKISDMVFSHGQILTIVISLIFFILACGKAFYDYISKRKYHLDNK